MNPSRLATLFRRLPACSSFRCRSMTESLLKTPLHDWHVRRAGRMVGFGGWEMPVQYSSIIAAHAAVRTVDASLLVS